MQTMQKLQTHHNIKIKKTISKNEQMQKNAKNANTAETQKCEKIKQMQ